MTALESVQAALRAAASPVKAAASQRFFKTGPGQYGEGDQFIGVIVPDQRRVANAHWKSLSLAETQALLRSPIHEERLTALFILVLKYQRGTEADRSPIYKLYLANTAHINNWDLVDSSAPYIVGPWLADKDRSILDRLATSVSLWERRIAVLATFHFIKLGQFDDALRIAGTLIADPHDLMHKAVGWMLREVGNRDRSVEEAFLAKHYRTMPRTMLRYAIEKFPPDRRAEYLSGTALP